MSSLPTTPLRQLTRLALPIVAVNLGQMMMSVVDTVMVGRLSAAAIGAVAIGTLFFFAAAISGEGILLALDPVISQAVGARDHRGQARGLQRGVVLSVLLTAPAAAFLWLSPPLLILLQQPVDVIPLARSYIWILIPSILPFFLFIALRQTLQALGRVRPILLTMLAANLLNMMLNWGLIFGNFGLPALGVAGSAWATTISRWCMVAVLLGVAWPLLRPLVRPWHPESRAVAPLQRMVWIGLPIAGQRMLEYLTFGITALAMGWIGTTALAGHQIALNLAAVSYMIPLGVGGAGAVLVGHAVGAAQPNEARRFAGLSLLLGGGVMVVGGTLFITVPSLLARFYTSDPGAMAVAVLLLPLAGVFAVFDGVQAVGLGVLRGLGDTRIPMIINLVGYWAIGLPAGFVLAFPVGMGATGLWWGLVIGLAIVALLLVYRIRVRFARDMPRVEVEEDGEYGMGNRLPGFGYQVPGVGGFGAVEEFLSTARGCHPDARDLRLHA
jgi:MATE family multidrug resistance protein